MRAATVGTTCEAVDATAASRHRRRVVSATGSSTAPATASGSRRTRTRTSCRAIGSRSRPGHTFSIEPGHLLPGPVRDAARGHRRGLARRARIDSTPRPATSPSSADAPSVNLDLGTVLLQWATGGLLFFWWTARREVVGLGLRLAASRGLRRDGARRGAARSALRSHRRGSRRSPWWAVGSRARGAHQRSGSARSARADDARGPMRLDIVAPAFGLVAHARARRRDRRCVLARGAPIARRARCSSAR